ncbi:MFS transporter [Nisaea sediminum]|uniref:MFS transporter n=1 Tax=Nisaea sediminum TaxID=2775867 RepID=UPI0018675B25|nr:MFS transporter [Nisaea sediminum]
MTVLGHPIVALMISVAFLWSANGLFHSLLGLRMSQEGFDTTVAGMVASSYFVGQLLGAAICGRIIESVGHVRSFAAFASVISACAVAHAIFVDPFFWGALRFATGICIAGALMVAESWLNGAVTNSNRGQMLSIYIVVMYFGMAAGQQILNVSPPTSFILYSVASILFSLALVPLSLASRATAGELTPSRLSLRELFRISPLGLICAFASGALGAAIMGLGPIFGNQIGLSIADIATMMSVSMFGGLLLQYPIGKLSDYFDRRTVITVALFAVAAVSFAIAVSFDGGWWMFLGLMVVYGGLNFALYPLAISHVNDHVEASDLVPASAGILIAASLGSSIGPVAGAFLMDQVGPGGLFHFSALIGGAVGLFAVYRMLRRAAPTMEEQGPYVAYARTSALAAELDPRGEVIEEVEPNVMDETPPKDFSYEEIIDSAVEGEAEELVQAKSSP